MSSIFDLDIDQQENGLVVSEYVSNKYNLINNDTVNLEIILPDSEIDRLPTQNIDVKTAGTHNGPIGQYQFIDIDIINSLLDTEIYNTIYLETNGKEINNSTKNKLVESIFINSIESSSQRNKQMDKLIQSLNDVILVLLFISTILALSIVYNIFTLNLLERIRDYSTMRTLGTSNTKIAKLIASELIIITIFGIIFGSISGYYVGNYILNNAEEFLDGFTIDLEFSYVGFTIASSIIIVSVLIVFLSSIYHIKKLNLANMIKSRSQ
jgi:putative ABC transport system permease protein